MLTALSTKTGALLSSSLSILPASRYEAEQETDDESEHESGEQDHLTFQPVPLLGTWSPILDEPFLTSSLDLIFQGIRLMESSSRHT